MWISPSSSWASPTGLWDGMSPVCVVCLSRERAVLSAAAWAPAVSARLMALGLWSAVNYSHRGDTLAVLCGCVNSGLLAELIQSKLECSGKSFRPLCAATLRTACCYLSPHFILKFICCWGFIHIQGRQWHLNVCGRWRMKCVERMDGAVLRLRSKRRYCAAVSSHLQGSRMLQGCVCLGFGCHVWPSSAFPGQRDETTLCWDPHFGVVRWAAEWVLQKAHGGKEQAKGLLKVEQ